MIEDKCSRVSFYQHASQVVCPKVCTGTPGPYQAERAAPAVRHLLA